MTISFKIDAKVSGVGAWFSMWEGEAMIHTDTVEKVLEAEARNKFYEFVKNISLSDHPGKATELRIVRTVQQIVAHTYMK